MINVRMPETQPISNTLPKILVIGVGGGGGNAVNNMHEAGMKGASYLVLNTDAQALERNQAENKIQIGSEMTQGLGAGARPEVGRAAAEESLAEIQRHLEGVNMVFITAGMGGGTGTGASAVVARAAREQGILTVAVVTKPFHFEGVNRMRLAESGISELQQYVDTLLVIPNQNLFRVANEKTTFADAFKMADEVLHSGVRGVTDLMVMPGLINLDFADIRSVMSEMGKAMMGTGEASGERRALEAAESAISNPLLEDVSIKGARGVLVNITGGMDMTLFEVDEASNRIREEVDAEANIIFGSTFDESMEGTMRVSVVATGIDGDMVAQKKTTSGLQNQRPVPTPPRSGGGGSGGGLKNPLSSAAPVVAGAPANNDAQTTVTPAVATATSAEIQPSLLDSYEAETQTETAPATTSSQTSGGHFIPAQPVIVDEDDEDNAAMMQTEAPEVNVMPAAPLSAAPRDAEKPKRKSASLFDRLTGRGSAAPQTEASQQPQAAPVMPVHPAVTPQAAAPSEDELDIPAFLRRQAN